MEAAGPPLLPLGEGALSLPYASADGKVQARAFAGSERHAPNSVEHGGTGIRLSEECGATRRFGERARFGVLVSGDTDEGGGAAFGHESLAKLDAGHFTKMNVEQQAVE